MGWKRSRLTAVKKILYSLRQWLITAHYLMLPTSSPSICARLIMTTDITELAQSLKAAAEGDN